MDIVTVPFPEFCSKASTAIERDNLISIRDSHALKPPKFPGSIFSVLTEIVPTDPPLARDLHGMFTIKEKSFLLKKKLKDPGNLISNQSVQQTTKSGCDLELGFSYVKTKPRKKIAQGTTHSLASASPTFSNCTLSGISRDEKANLCPSRKSSVRVVEQHLLHEMSDSSQHLRLALTVTHLLLVALGSLNLLVIFLILSKQYLRSITNVYMVGLCLADFIYLTDLSLVAATSLNLKSWPFGSALCHFYHGTETTVRITSQLERIVVNIIHLFPYVNCALNPLLYAYRAENFRIAFKSLFFWSASHPISDERSKTGLLEKRPPSTCKDEANGGKERIRSSMDETWRSQSVLDRPLKRSVKLAKNEKAQGASLHRVIEQGTNQNERIMYSVRKIHDHY
ncbi:hypothetical protein NECAME_01478 [Necator americanus]|uniref:G-protein coupled receptors family 1 profile domain-containing protein n=1 Tax=Necator americanus TaxID=51031 RepID=W2TT19_NECAM|nr:hypothetical protein NECAME_01478 [Necator americanus]ETN84918.1 hypothetical protein NECAME_01478 [Necator americanus]